MPAVSQAQQKAAGMALAAKRKEISANELKGAAKDMFNSMSIKELEDLAATERKNLPEHKED